MNQAQARDWVDGECVRRIKEVRHLVMVVPDMQDVSARTPMMRACVVLFYGHFEGFIKFSSRIYLEFLEKQELVPLHLSETWMDKETIHFDALLKVVRILDIDESLFMNKQKFLRSMYGQRNAIAHGDDLKEIAQVGNDSLKETAVEICEVIDYFRDEILRLVEERRSQ